MFLGDTHGNLSHLEKTILHCRSVGVERILQLGDFGYWEQTALGIKFLDLANELLQVSKIPLDFIDGNHENHNMLRDGRYPLSNGKREIRSHICHLERGTIHEYGDTVVAALGGAWSIDQESRKEGWSWFATEEATQEDVDKFKGRKADILISHDAPSFIDLNQISWANRGFDYKPFPASERQRNLIQQAVDELEVKEVYHGHHHMRYNATVDGVRVEGLDCDGSGNSSWLIKEL